MIQEQVDAKFGILTRNLQVIHGAMVMGVVMFFGLAWVMKPAKVDEGFSQILLIVIIAAAGGSFLMSVLLPGLLVNSKALVLAKQEVVTPAELFGAIQVSHIIRLALLEGATILVLMFLFLTGNQVFLVLGGILIGIMAMVFPSRGRIIERAQALEDQIAMLRQSGG